MTLDLGFTHRIERGRGAAGTTVLLLHGTGGDESDLIPLGRMLLPEATFIGPRGKVLEHGMPRFFRRLAEGVFDVPDLIARTHELAQFVRDAAEGYRLDASKIDAVGFSNGANIAASLLLLHPGLIRNAVLFRPMVPLEPESPPDLRDTAALIAGGRMDPIVPPEQTERLGELLRESGAEVMMAWQPAGHGLTQGDVQASKAWLEQRLGGGAAT
ncbi:MAG TPA: alpha/beta hydrolase [Gemmatimonadaceae bacterium]|nr:alpha/beta hydrolase [Gemmatimonadaceae bacterium]